MSLGKTEARRSGWSISSRFELAFTLSPFMKNMRGVRPWSWLKHHKWCLSLDFGFGAGLQRQLDCGIAAAESRRDI
jgi:hypothetical protein